MRRPETIDRYHHRSYIIDLLFIALICCTGSIVTSGQEIITIKDRGTDNALLLYKDKPMFKTGPISEDRVFMYSIGSGFFNHKEWFDYMQKYSFEFGRVYPAHAWHSDQVVQSRKPLYPFLIKHRTKQVYPVVDLLTPDKQYWSNFSKVLEEAEKKDIVLCIQLYQRWYWGNSAARNQLFFHRDYNINDIHEIDSRTFWKHTSDSYPNGKLWRVHENFVKNVLNAIGDHRNIIIDLMNEGCVAEGVTRAWIDRTLEIIQTWENNNGRDILVGMDMDHFLQKKDTANLDWLLEHPGMELIIGEDKWIYFDTNETIAKRKIYKKPIIWVNEKANGYMDTFSLTDHPNRRLHYLWLGMMMKVQCLGLYEKGNHTQEHLLQTPEAKALGNFNRTLMKFFNNTITDYAALKCRNDIIEKSPQVRQKLALSSPNETIIYLHSGFGVGQIGGTELKLNNLEMPERTVSVQFIHPDTGEITTGRTVVDGGRAKLVLPAFHENIAVYLKCKQ
ncbi:MAG: hypothetical protein RQ760_06495 [Sedimentisphaerales bacterium]|nr:hypothetical protein [Sedimentisphaerales bacterium]